VTEGRIGPPETNTMRFAGAGSRSGLTVIRPVLSSSARLRGCGVVIGRTVSEHCYRFYDAKIPHMDQAHGDRGVLLSKRIRGVSGRRLRVLWNPRPHTMLRTTRGTPFPSLFRSITLTTPKSKSLISLDFFLDDSHEREGQSAPSPQVSTT
jgi:hypothetical protein